MMMREPSSSDASGEKTNQTTQQRPKSTTTIREDIDSAMGYGTGYTQMKVKQNTATKLDKIQQKHNKALEE